MTARAMAAAGIELVGPCLARVDRATRRLLRAALEREEVPAVMRRGEFVEVSIASVLISRGRVGP
ncbi:MAG TPA: hypothetical protein VNW68_08530 [Candidatus Limnocylindria bacterium]|nr:hypothetical protein [Candidatus Limnocylindria bacterium]